MVNDIIGLLIIQANFVYEGEDVFISILKAFKS